jgi:hypothetical protein
VVTEAREAAGGDIEIDASQKIELVDSQIATSVLGGIGGGGDIDIGTGVPPTFVVLNASEVRAQADLGDGGNIQIRTSNLLASADSVLSASSNLGVDGLIIVDAPENTLRGDEHRLPDNLLDATELLKEHCAARNSDASTFIVRGRDGMPESPDLPLPSRMPARTRTGDSQRSIPEPARRLATFDCSGRAIFAMGSAVGERP